MRSVFRGLVLGGLLAASAMAQDQREGTDIAWATPVFFGQTIQDTGDASVRPASVYRISLARGQRMIVTINRTAESSGLWNACVLRPSSRSLGTLVNDDYSSCDSRSPSGNYGGT